MIYKQIHCFPFVGFRASAEFAKGSARITQLVSPVLQRKDIDVCVLQSLRANTAQKVTMAPNIPLCSCKFSFSVIIANNIPLCWGKFSFSVIIAPNIHLCSCKLSFSAIIVEHHTLR